MNKLGLGLCLAGALAAGVTLDRIVMSSKPKDLRETKTDMTIVTPDFYMTSHSETKTAQKREGVGFFLEKGHKTTIPYAVGDVSYFFDIEYVGKKNGKLYLRVGNKTLPVRVGYEYQLSKEDITYHDIKLAVLQSNPSYNNDPEGNLNLMFSGPK